MGNPDKQIGTQAALPTDLGIATEAGPVTATAQAALERGTQTGLTAFTNMTHEMGETGVFDKLQDSKYAKYMPTIKQLFDDNKTHFADLTLDKMTLNWLAKQRLVEMIAKRSGYEFKKGEEGDTQELYSRSFVLAATKSGSIVAFTPGVAYTQETSATKGEEGVTLASMIADTTAETAAQPGGQVVYLQINDRKAGAEVKGGITTPHPIDVAHAHSHVTALTGAVVRDPEKGSRHVFTTTHLVPTLDKQLSITSTDSQGKEGTFYTNRLVRIYYLQHPSEEDVAALLNMLKGGFDAIDQQTFSQVAAPAKTGTVSMVA